MNIENSFYDNVAYDFECNMIEKRLILRFDSYYDDEREEDILVPCEFIIRDWSKVLSSEILDENEIETNAIIPFYVLLKLELRKNYILVFSLSENKSGDIYRYLKFYNASYSFIPMDMSKNVNVFEDVHDIKGFLEKDFFTAHIPKVYSKEDLLQHLKTYLHIPSHIECSWNNLAEVISTPFWLDNWRNLVIVHDDISLMSEIDLDHYLQVIDFCRLRTIHVYFVFNKKDIIRIRWVR